MSEKGSEEKQIVMTPYGDSLKNAQQYTFSRMSSPQGPVDQIGMGLNLFGKRAPELSSEQVWLASSELLICLLAKH